MILRISDVTEIDHTAEFRSDVQVSHFRTEANLGLIENYMFTVGSFPGRKSSAEMLRLLQEAVVEEIENRFIIQATYGRGKSHFGLVVANYFGKAAEAPEVKRLLEKLEHAYNEPAQVESFRSFKKHHKPYLVVLLRGDAAVNLRDQFFRELEAALKATEATKHIEAPFWFNEALRFITGLDAEQQNRANQFLEKHSLDLHALHQKVQQRETGTYTLCVELFKNIIGYRPDFNGETSLVEAIQWVVRELVGKGHVGGLLILFDEFSEFVRGYNSLHPVGIPLQELLNGVEQNRGKVLFVALSQHEPERVISNDGTQGYESLVKELTRLPRANRYWLHSTLEDVLGAYFKPHPDKWKQMMGEPGVSSQVAGASEIAYEVFADRYRRILHWSAEDFQEKVTRECFPLHPLTTALLSSVDFEAASTTRSVLGFLIDEKAPLKQKLQEPAVVEGRPNWVLPIALVDYFEGMLGEQVWEQYKQIDQPDLTPEQKAVLKGMLLQKAASIPTKSVGFSVLIAELSGLTQKQAEQTLKQLEEQRYIRYDSANKVYSFWAGSNAAIELEKLLNQELSDLERHGKLKTYIDEFDTNGHNKVNDLLAKEKGALCQQYPVSVDWGHEEDWKAQLVVLTRASCKIDTLTRLAARYSASITEMPDCRGLVLLPLARSQDDLDWLIENLQRTLDSSAKLKAAPIVVIIPNRPTPELIINLQKYALLEDRVFEEKIVRQIGATVIQEEKDRLGKQILQVLDQVRKDGTLEVPADARGHIRALSIDIKASDRIVRTLREVYRIAYHSHPADFYNQYKHTATNLRSAVQTLIPVLMTDNLAGAYVGLGNVAKDVVDKFLAADVWGLFTPKRRIQPPRSTHLKKAWERLEGSIPPGKDWILLKEVLLELLNLPYGYDHNSLSLLFSAWLGYYRRDIELALNGKIVGFDSISGEGKKLKPKEFIEAWSAARLRRKDRREILRDVEQAVDRVGKGGLSLEEAESILEKLKASANENDITDPKLLEDARLSISKLQEAFGQLKRYDEAVKDIEDKLAKALSVSTISTLLDKLAKLEEPFIVVSRLPGPLALRQKVLERARELTEDICKKNEYLSDIRQYGRQEEALKRALAELHRLGLTELTQRVQQALDQLEKEQLRLTQEREIEILLNQINSFDSTGNLSRLRKNLSELKKYIGHEAETIRTAAQNKAADIEAEVKRLEAFILNLDKRLDAVSNAEEARALEREIIKERGRFEGTPDIGDISAAEERVAKLIDFFSEVEGDLPKSTEEANHLINKLAELPSIYEGCLSDAQRQKIENRIREIQEYAKVQGEEARRWLEDCRQRLDSGEDLQSVEEALSKPHPFLPEDMQPLLEGLREELLNRRVIQRQEEEVLKRVADMPTSGSLADLCRRKQELSGMQGSERIRTEASKKLNLIENSIAELETQAKQWIESFDTLAASREIEALREQVYKSISKYENTDIYEALEAFGQRCKVVGKILEEVEARTPLESREAVRQRIARLEELKNTPELGKVQRQVIDEAIERVKAYQAQKESEAMEWLADQERELSMAQVQPETLKQKLSQPPIFLPESELARLEALREEVEAVLERRLRDKEIQQRLRSLPRVRALRELREQQQEVLRWLEEAQSPEVRKALEAKRAELDADIHSLLESINNYRAKLAEVVEYTRLRSLIAELKDFAARFIGTSEADEIKELQVQADRLGDYLENLRTFKPSAVESPIDADRQIEEIKKLMELYPGLSEAHRRLGHGLIAQIASTVQQKRDEARQWLTRGRIMLDSEGQLETLEQELKSPSPFLTDDEYAELARLRNSLQQRLDQNTRERIEQLFMRLSASERQDCLARLYQLLQEERV